MKPKDLVLLFARTWQARYGRQYPISWGKAVGQAARLLKLYPGDELAAYVKFFFTEHADAFARQGGHSLDIFVATLPKVIAAFSAEQAKREQAAGAGADFERLEAARKSLVPEQVPAKQVPQGEGK